MSQDDKLKAYLAYASVSFFWGTTYLAIRIGVEVFPPVLFAGLRFLGAGLVLSLFLLLRGYKLPPLAEMKNIAIVGISLLAIANGTVVWCEQFVPSSLTALIITTLPFCTATLEAAWPGGERLTLQKMAGMFVGFVGIVVLLWPELQGTLEPTYLFAIVALLIAPISWSAGSIYSKYNKIKTPPLMAAAMQMLVAGLVLVVAGTIKGEIASVTFDPQGWLAMAYLLVFGSIVGYGSYIYALDKLPASIVSTYAYLNPIVAVFLGWLILDERLDAMMALATVIILTGVMLVKSSKRPHPNADRGLPEDSDSATSEREQPQFFAEARESS